MGRLDAGEAGLDDVQHGGGISGQSFRWPNGLIPYDIDPNLPNQNRVSEAQASIPEEVKRLGITVTKTLAFPLLLVSLYSPNNAFNVLHAVDSTGTVLACRSYTK